MVGKNILPHAELITSRKHAGDVQRRGVSWKTTKTCIGRKESEKAMQIEYACSNWRKLTLFLNVTYIQNNGPKFR